MLQSGNNCYNPHKELLVGHRHTHRSYTTNPKPGGDISFLNDTRHPIVAHPCAFNSFFCEKENALLSASEVFVMGKWELNVYGKTWTVAFITIITTTTATIITIIYRRVADL